MAIPSEREPGSHAEVRLTVTGTGEVDPESIEVEGDVSPRMREHLVEVTKRMRLRAARVRDCWVASTYGD